jgi:hypothetical protein
VVETRPQTIQINAGHAEVVFHYAALEVRALRIEWTRPSDLGDRNEVQKEDFCLL